MSPAALDDYLAKQDFIPMTIVSLACQLNKSSGESRVELTSLTECIKGAMIRVPGSQTSSETLTEGKPSQSRISRPTRGTRPVPFMDPKSGRLLGFGVNLITFLVLGYFLGGFALNPVLGRPSCEGLNPCVGSVLGLFISAIGSLAYTYYYFVRKI